MQVVFAKANGFVMTPDGGRYTVRGGQHWPADDPVVHAQPGLFSTDPRYGLAFSSQPVEDPSVEEVTARPGEKRSGVRRG